MPRDRLAALKAVRTTQILKFFFAGSRGSVNCHLLTGSNQMLIY